MPDLWHVRARLLSVGILVTGLLTLAPPAAHASFGIASFDSTLSTPQAGAHADVSTSFTLNTDALGNPVGQLRTATTALPEGLIGNPQAIARCSIKQLESFNCPHDAQVGVLGMTINSCEGVTTPLEVAAEPGATKLTVPNAHAFCNEEGLNKITVGSGASAEQTRIATISNATTLELDEPLTNAHAAGEAVTHIASTTTGSFPLFNVEPTSGHVATFAASFLLTDVYVQVSASTNGRLTATIREAPTIFPITASTLTLWGVPAAPTHNALRCNEFLFECGPSPAGPAPFMTDPTGCEQPLQTAFNITSWQGQSDAATATTPPLSGCELLTSTPSLSVTPSTTRRDTPAGYEIAVKVPQDEQPYDLATPAFKDVKVTLPGGTSLSPALANGLQTCTDAQLASGACPGASQVGTAEIISPLLGEHLTGAIYIGASTATEKYRVFVSVSANGATINLAGRAETNESTGQVTAVFTNVPQLPFSTFKLNFFAGPNAAFANPQACGAATSTSQLTSASGQASSPSSTFLVDNNGESAPCPASLPFNPSFVAGTTTPLAGAFSPFTMTVSRADGDASLSSFTAQLPPGLVGLLKTVPPCPRQAAAEGACPQSSEIGTATIATGAGAQPLDVPATVYLTGPYAGAPFGLAIVMNVNAGPFSLGKAVVRARILVNPSTIALTIASDPFPQILAGIPLRVRTVNVTMNRPGFITNPTNCGAQSVTAVINTTIATSATATSRFRVAGCSALNFAPRLSAATQSSASIRGHGASLAMTITTPATSTATTHGGTIEMPSQLRPRLATLQQACHLEPARSSPTRCPAASRVGEATVTTPVLPGPLSGSIYLVSQGKTATPSLVLLLNGNGITVDLEGALKVSHQGAIKIAFTTLPDIPITSFAISLPGGPHSMLGAVQHPCSKALRMPYAFTDQSGAQVSGNARVAVSGCVHSHPPIKNHRGKRASARTKSQSNRRATREPSHQRAS